MSGLDELRIHQHNNEEPWDSDNEREFDRDFHKGEHNDDPEGDRMAELADQLAAERQRADLAEGEIAILLFTATGALNEWFRLDAPNLREAAAAAARVLAVAERIDALRDGPGYTLLKSPELGNLLNELEEQMAVLRANGKGEFPLPWTGDERANR